MEGTHRGPECKQAATKKAKSVLSTTRKNNTSRSRSMMLLPLLSTGKMHPGVLASGLGFPALDMHILESGHKDN